MTGFRKSILPAATWPLGEMKLDEVRRPGVEEPLLVSPWFLNGDALYAAMKPTTVLQMIAAVPTRPRRCWPGSWSGSPA